jgi:hypothetical protein
MKQRGWPLWSDRRELTVPMEPLVLKETQAILALTVPMGQMERREPGWLWVAQRISI